MDPADVLIFGIGMISGIVLFLVVKEIIEHYL